MFGDIVYEFNTLHSPCLVQKIMFLLKYDIKKWQFARNR